MLRCSFFLTLFVFGFSLSVTLADDEPKPLSEAPEPVRAFIAFSQVQRKKWIDYCEFRMEEPKRAREEKIKDREEKAKWKIKKSENPGTFDTKTAKADYLKQVDAEIQKLDAEIANEEGFANAVRTEALFTSVPPFTERFAVGSFGKLGGDSPLGGGGMYCVVIQVIDKKNMLLAYRSIADRSGPIVWIKGTSTSDYADGVGIKLDEVFRVTGTTKYNNALGADKTVYVLEPFDTESARPFAVKPVVAKPVVKDIVEGAKPNPAKEPDPQKTASQKLSLAKSLLKSNPLAAKKRLEEIVKLFPNTEAGTEAQKLLGSLE